MGISLANPGMTRNTLGLFVTGTDTGVGKSLLACALVRWLRAAKIDAVGFKPVATGEVAGEWSDAVGLYEATGRCEPIEKICPFRFKLAAAPTIAARHEGFEADFNLARWAVSELCQRHSAVIAEGVGGLLAPLDTNTLVIDFAVQLGFPILLVCRASLGTINHTVLTLREIERSPLQMAGIVMSVTEPADMSFVAEVRAEIERIAKQKIAAVIPYLSAAKDGPAPTREELVGRAITSLEDQLDLKQLLGMEGRRKKQTTQVRLG